MDAIIKCLEGIRQELVQVDNSQVRSNLIAKVVYLQGYAQCLKESHGVVKDNVPTWVSPTKVY